MPSVFSDQAGRAVIFRPTVWQRRCLWVWNAGNDFKTTADYIAQNARTFGYTAVCIKVHDGASVFTQGDNDNPAYYRKLLAAGLKVGGWGYLLGDGMDGNARGGVEAEAQRAVERCRALGLDFYVADPEDHYAKSGDNGANSPAPGAGWKRFGYSARFVKAFASAVKNPLYPRGVASYGRVDYHDLDWHAWAARGPDNSVWRCIPQAYLNESEALAPDLCTRAAERYWARALIHPLLGVYDGHLGRSSPSAYSASLVKAGTTGYGIYSLDAIEPSQLPAYGHLPRARPYLDARAW